VALNVWRADARPSQTAGHIEPVVVPKLVEQSRRLVDARSWSRWSQPGFAGSQYANVVMRTLKPDVGVALTVRTHLDALGIRDG
jgi:hypothetical protein